jgi:RNA polymerase sigma-70 factor, ECF subfamily
MAEVPKTDSPIERARQGDNEAISDLYQQHHQSIFRYLYYRIGDASIAEDLTSEVFIRMIRSLPGYQNQETPFLAWLFRIAHNLSVDYFRKTNTLNLVPLEETLMNASDDLNKAFDRSLTSQRLAQALQNLSVDQRDVIVLRFVAGMPIVEVAQSLSKSEDAVKGLQRRGLAALRQILAEWEINYA